MAITTREDVEEQLRHNALRLTRAQLAEPDSEICLLTGQQVMQWLKQRAISKYDPDLEHSEGSLRSTLETLSQLTPVLYLSVVIDGGAGDWSVCASEAAGNHIWLNAFQCINPSPQFLRDLGKDIIDLTRQAWGGSDGRELVFCSLNKS